MTIEILLAIAIGTIVAILVLIYDLARTKTKLKQIEKCFVRDFEHQLTKDTVYEVRRNLWKLEEYLRIEMTTKESKYERKDGL